MSKRSGFSTIEKPQDTKKTLRKLFQYVKGVKWLLGLAIVLTLLANGLQLWGPFYTGKIIDLISGPTDLDLWVKLRQLLIVLILVYVASSILMYAFLFEVFEHSAAISGCSFFSFAESMEVEVVAAT